MNLMLGNAAAVASQDRSAMTVPRHPLLIAAALLALVVASAGAPLYAQPSKGPPNALQGFSQNRDQPVHIEAATLEVRDKDKVATFSGDVHVTQGDTKLRCKSLVVFYEQDDAAADKSKTLKAANPGPGGQQRIKRLEARGGVVVTQKEQTATGETGMFDMKTNTVTLNGKVVMTQGKNVLRGDRLVVDLTSGVSRVESGKNGRPRAGPVSAQQRGARSQVGHAGRARRRRGHPIDPTTRFPTRPAARGGEESAKLACPAMMDDRRFGTRMIPKSGNRFSRQDHAQGKCAAG